jgi:hypothetical protein
VASTYHPSHSRKYKTGQLGQDPISKITRAKKAGGMAQAGECLPSKCESPSSNTSTSTTTTIFYQEYIPMSSLPTKYF